MATERQQALCKNVSVFFAVLFLIGAIILSFATHLVASPMLCFATALFFYGLFVYAQRKVVTPRGLLLTNIVLALTGILQLFSLNGSEELFFWLASLPLAMFLYYVPYWTALVIVLYIATMVTSLALPTDITGIDLNAIDVKTALILVTLLPTLCLPMLFMQFGDRDKKETHPDAADSEKEMLNAVATLFYRLRTSLNSLQGAVQLLKNEEPIDEKQQRAVREMLDESIVALNDMVNSLFVTRALSSESSTAEQFNLHAKIRGHVTVQFASLGLDDTPSFSFDPAVPALVEGDSAYVDQAIERILGGIIYDNLMQHEPLTVNTLILGAPRGESLLVKVEFECGNLSSQIISDDSLFGEKQKAFLGSLRIRRAAHGVAASFTIPLTVVTKSRQRVDVVEVAKKKEQETTISGSKLLAEARILVVEDNAINRRVMKITLQNIVGSIALAENGQEAVEMVKKNDYDIILMDVQMPVLNGYEATQAIRQLEKKRSGHIPIVALTAYALRGDRERCLQAGMDTYIAKPFQKDALLAIMTRELVKAHKGKA